QSDHSTVGAATTFARARQEGTIMDALRHRSEALPDPRPVLALVLAGEHLALRGGKEQCRTARPGMPRHRLDAAVDEIRQALAQLAPGPAAIAAFEHR